jgi:superfamily II DNA helicase RecQ
MSSLRIILHDRFGFSEFRSSQEQVCQSIVDGQDALVVMPTGAGKSLCYQLPGIARKGTTLVISPLLALIDDQVAKLAAKGMRVEQIHSGRTREQSREACIRYLKGELEFLFIAPERLAVPGFPEMLEKRRPALIAIDEAHCISQWGHDFRPEYRRLGERLGRLRRGAGGNASSAASGGPTGTTVSAAAPTGASNGASTGATTTAAAPIVALTATATTLVQDDILQQLGIPTARKFIQGFRRTNIAIRVHEVPVPDRGQAAAEILAGKGRLPAIVYAPTRKAAEEISAKLTKAARGKLRASCYHAGLDSDTRETVQEQFLAGKTDVIVATIAFGMGIDKADVRTVIHAGLSGSVEGYYQEIGRAGRDALPSEAILMHSFADQRTHDFFFERDYPEIAALDQVHRGCGPKAKTADEIYDEVSKLSRETFDKALEKLRIHGGLIAGLDGLYTRGTADWKMTYERQRLHREKSLQQMMDFVQSTSCRMSYFLRYFGDRDSKGDCGICDRCTRAESSASRELTSKEKTIAKLTLAALSQSHGLSIGRLFDQVGEYQRGVDRKLFEAVVDLLGQEGWVNIRRDSFTNESGKLISYRRAEITDLGESSGAGELDDLRIADAFAVSEKEPKKRKSPRVRRRKPSERTSGWAGADA